MTAAFSGLRGNVQLVENPVTMQLLVTARLINTTWTLATLADYSYRSTTTTLISR